MEMRCYLLSYYLKKNNKINQRVHIHRPFLLILYGNTTCFFLSNISIIFIKVNPTTTKSNIILFYGYKQNTFNLAFEICFFNADTVFFCY